MTLQVELVSPEEVVFSGECSEVVARTTDGEIAFLTGHSPFIGALAVGDVQLWTGDGVMSIAVGGGFIEVSHDVVTILSDSALLEGRIDVAQAEADLAAAEAALAADPDDEAATTARQWAEHRLRRADETRG
jgi:F-type H+-transporting ATPase subunit epsilon